MGTERAGGVWRNVGFGGGCWVGFYGGIVAERLRRRDNFAGSILRVDGFTRLRTLP